MDPQYDVNQEAVFKWTDVQLYNKIAAEIRHRKMRSQILIAFHVNMNGKIEAVL